MAKVTCGEGLLHYTLLIQASAISKKNRTTREEALLKEGCVYFVELTQHLYRFLPLFVEACF